MNRRWREVAGTAAVAWLLAAPPSALAGKYRWTRQPSPESAAPTAIVPDPATIGESWIFAGGTLYRAFESDEPWRPLRAGVFSFTRHSPTGRLYTVDTTGLATSYDGGETWVSRPIPAGGHSLTVSGEALPKIYVVSGSSVFRSTTDGASWDEVFKEWDGLALRQVAAVSSSLPVVYTLASGGQLISYRSTDGGETWQRGGEFIVNSIPTIGFYVHLLEASQHDPNLVFATSPFVGLFRSTDGGGSWSLLRDNYTYYTSRLAFDPIHSQRILIGRAGSPAFVESTNAGTSWSPLSTGLPFEDGSTVSALSLEPNGRVHAGIGRGTSGVRVSSGNGGAGWRALPSTGVGGGEAVRVEAHPDDPQSVWLAGRFALYRSDDRGESWETLGALELADLQVHPADPDRLFGIEQDGGSSSVLMRSLDGGRSWTRLTVAGDRVWRFALDPSDPDVLYAVDRLYPSPATLYRSVDAGQTWIPRSEFPGGEFVVDPSDGDTLYAVGGEGLLRSRDAGASWNFVDDPLPQSGYLYFLCFDLVDPSILYVLGTYPQFPFQSFLAVSRDSGNSWERHPATGEWWAKLRPDPALAGGVYIFDGYYHSRFLDAGERRLPVSRLGIPRFNAQFLLEDLTVSADGQTLYLTSSDILTWGFWIYDRVYDDVPSSDPLHASIDAVAFAGMSAGCSPTRFCAEAMLTRGQAAVLVTGLRQFYFPPEGTVFSDVGPSTFGAAQIEWLGTEGYSSGCGGGRFCPDEPFTRAQAAVLTLAVRDGWWRVPPPATGAVFADVPASHFAAAWIEEFARQGYSAGCAPNLFCPEQAVSRGQMAVFLTSVFNLW
jgi:photosystem II stability/assembly factor-like uncharacterized protein